MGKSNCTYYLSSKFLQNLEKHTIEKNLPWNIVPLINRADVLAKEQYNYHAVRGQRRSLVDCFRDYLSCFFGCFVREFEGDDEYVPACQATWDYFFNPWASSVPYTIYVTTHDGAITKTVSLPQSSINFWSVLHMRYGIAKCRA